MFRKCSPPAFYNPLIQMKHLFDNGIVAASLSVPLVCVQEYGNWKAVYIVIIAFLAGLVLALELVTWIMYPTRKAAKNAEMGKVAAGRGRDEEATETVNHP